MSARTILNPPLINELNGLFDGTSDITASTITATDYVVLGTNGGINAVLECSTSNTVQVGNISGGAPAGNIRCAGITATGTITASGTITATTFAGGIVAYNDNFTATWSANSAVATSITIPNFIGSSASAYVITGINPSISEPTAAFLILSLTFTGNTDTGTTLDLQAYNTSSTGFSATVYYSIIAMN